MLKKYAELNKKNNQLQKLESVAIEKAWKSIKAVPPWSAQKFLEELSKFETKSIFEIIEISKNEIFCRGLLRLIFKKFILKYVN